MFKLRLLFASVGALGCLLVVLCLEAIFLVTHLEQIIDDRASPILILRSDLARRLEATGGKSGEVQISLSWNNSDDLDLSCLSPLNETIDFQVKRSRSGGILDVDSNVSPPFSERPVENIVWPYGQAPPGRYRVYVNQYSSHGSPSHDATPFRLVVMVRGRSHELTGTIRHGDGKRLVYEFDTARGTMGSYGLPMAILRAVLLTGIWITLVSGSLTLALALGQSRFYRRYYEETLLDRKELLRLVGWGCLSGLCAGVAGQFCFSLLSIWVPVLPVAHGRLAGWLLLAFILCVMLGRRMPNLKAEQGVVALGFALLWGLCATLRALIVQSNRRVSESPADLLLVPLRWIQEVGGTVGRVEAALVLGAFIGFLVVLAIPEEEHDGDIEPQYQDLRMYLTSSRLRSHRSTTARTLRQQPRRGRRKG